MSSRPDRSPLAVLSLAFLAIACIVGYGPKLADFTANTWDYRPHYQHFPFVVVAAVLLFAQQLAWPPAGAAPGRWWARLGAVLAIVLLAAGQLLVSPLLALISAIVLAGAAGAAIARRLAVPFPLGPWALLWLIVPPPLGLDARVIEAMQRQSSALASYSLDALGVEHLMDGNALLLSGKTLFVDEACSGIVSAVSIFACAAMYGVWRRRKPVRVVALMALSVLWAVLMNVLRITAIALAESLAGWNWAEGFAHTLVGLGAFAFALVSIVLTDWLLDAVLAPIGDRWALMTGEPIRYGRVLVDAWDMAVGGESAGPKASRPQALKWNALVGSGDLRGSLVVSAALVILGALGLASPDPDTVRVDFPQADAFASALQAPGVLPDRVGELRLSSVEHLRREADSLFATHSVVFVYTKEGERYLVSCDFPYGGGWHELSVCYQGIGWRLDGRTIKKIEDASRGTGASYDAALLDLTRPDESAALVAFCGAFVDGEPAPAPAMTLQESFWNAFSRRATENRSSYQTQVITEDADLISDRQRDECERLLVTAQGAFARVAASVFGR